VVTLGAWYCLLFGLSGYFSLAAAVWSWYTEGLALGFALLACCTGARSGGGAWETYREGQGQGHPMPPRGLKSAATHASQRQGPSNKAATTGSLATTTVASG